MRKSLKIFPRPTFTSLAFQAVLCGSSQLWLEFPPVLMMATETINYSNIKRLWMEIGQTDALCMYTPYSVSYRIASN